MDFIDSNGNWMKSKLEEFFCKDDVEIIRRMPTNLKLQDKWIWHFDKKGIYLVQSGYKVFVDSKLRVSSSNNSSGEDR